MSSSERTDVLVVGAGPVGLMTALGLARQGADVQIVDEDERTGLHSFALALHPLTLRLLDNYGLAGELIERGHKIERLSFLDGDADRPALSFDFTRLSGKFPFALVLPQHVLESTLEEELLRQDVRVLWNHRAQAILERPAQVQAQVARLDKRPDGGPAARRDWRVDRVLEFRSGYLVGADGCRSYVREHLEAGYRKVGVTQTFAVFEFDSPARLGHVMRVVLRDGRANVLWPMSGGTCRWSFQIDPAEVHRSETESGSYVLGSNVLGYLNQRLGHRAPWFPPADGRVRWSPLVQFDPRLVNSFGRRRVWLAGDAAHQTGPIGVHSLNAGLAEAWELAGLIVHRLRGRLSPFVLKTYGERRSRVWSALLGLGGTLRVTDAAGAWVRRWAETIPSCVPATGRDLQRLLDQAGLMLDGLGEELGLPAPEGRAAGL